MTATVGAAVALAAPAAAQEPEFEASIERLDRFRLFSACEPLTQAVFVEGAAADLWNPINTLVEGRLRAARLPTHPKTFSLTASRHCS